MQRTEQNFRKSLTDMVAKGEMSVEDVLAIVDDWGRGDADSDDVALLSKVEPGWFAFARGRFSPYPGAYSNCQGVVAWVNPDKNAPKGQRGLIVTPEEDIEVWSLAECVVGATDEENGQENTKKILAYGREHNVHFPAAALCALYCKNGVRQGEGFLPARRQLERIYANEEIINPSLREIGEIFGGDVWSSTEYDAQKATCVIYSDGTVANACKRDDIDEHWVRCVLAF